MKKIGHASVQRRIAIMVGSGHVPGLNAVVMGAASAAGLLGWETVGIRDGFDGLLYPERYPDGGLVKLKAVLKPKDTAVAAMSFSIERGTHTALSPLRWSL